MLTLYYLSAAAVAAVIVGVGLWLHFKAPAKLNILFKTISLILATALFVRYMIGSDNHVKIIHLQVGYGFTAKGWVALALVQVWICYAAELVMILASFFKFKTLNAIVSFFCSVAVLLNFAFMFNHIIAITGRGAFTKFNVRAFLMAIETGIGLGYCVLHTFVNRKNILLKNTEWAWFAAAVVAIFCAAIPNYAFQYVLDPTQIAMIAQHLNFFHRMMLYPIAIIPITMYLLLKDKDYDARKFAVTYYALVGLITISHAHRIGDFMGKIDIFGDDGVTVVAHGAAWVTSLPLHLCNTAMYITPLCLILNRKKLFYFTYFINVFGAAMALLMPNYNESGILADNVWRFYMNHYQAFFMPLLIVALGIFRRPRWKEFKYSLIGFVVYFVLILFINAWFTNYNSDVDYFFLNSDFIVSKLGSWAQNTRRLAVHFNIGSLKFVFYPIYQTIFFLVYVVVAFAMWFVYELAYNVIVGWQDIAARNKKIKVDKLALEVKLAGRSIEEPMSMENINKLVLKKFTKRYGTSDVYAVKDVDLEVCGGEIFGFLGPNGAGKSTIIKSIVGIQTITEGAIEVCGFDVRTQPVQAKKEIGFVPDHYALYERLTAREYINYIADLYEVTKEDREERLNRLVELFEFQTAIDNPIKTYSHGMKQKVTIMSALIHNPKVWILDEPLTGLDPNSIFQVKECMKRHAQQGNIVFFSSHIIDVVERICDKIAIIRKGQIQCVRDVHEMEKNGESLEEFYMKTINDSEVNAIAVEGAAAEAVPVKRKKRGLFGRGKADKAPVAPADAPEAPADEQPAQDSDVDQHAGE